AADVTNTLTVDGAAVNTSLTQGQSADYTFAGTANQHLGLGIGALTTTPTAGTVSVTVIDPDNHTTLVSCGSYSSNAPAGGNCNLPVLPVSGNYTVRV